MMRIPPYWAESTLCQTQDGKPVTVRRYGWSEHSAEDAQQNADARARDAAERIAAGEAVVRREPRLGYNGADGAPIREEIVDQRGDNVLTRNSYGALCLNSPDVLFVDIDDPSFERPVLGNASVWTVGILMAILVGVFVNMRYSPHGWLMAGLILVATALIGLKQGREGKAQGERRRSAGLAQVQTLIADFLRDRPDWHLRLYQTPGGLRLLVTHRTFDPNEPEVQACFDAFGADPIFARMCLSQQCFRARVSPKPWRMGWRRGMPAALSHWPVAAEQATARQRWIADYTSKAKAFAACHFIAEFGAGTSHPRALGVQDWHDALCQSGQNRLPLA